MTLSTISAPLPPAASLVATRSPASGDDEALAALLGEFRTEAGRTLLEVAQESPVLLIFLRHFGCSFCRETLERVSQIRGQLEARGVQPVFVHLATPERAKPYFDYYRLADVERVSNPEATLYRHPLFALGRTNPWSHFFRPAVVKAWFWGGVRAHGIGLPREDGHQMPGVFYLRGGKIANFYRHHTIADRPDYLALAG